MGFTIILCDCSLSLARPVFPLGSQNVSSTRKELIQRGVAKFVEWLATERSDEWLALATFSAGTKLVVPFTRQHEAISHAIYELKLEDRTDVAQAVHSVARVVGLSKAHAPARVVLVVDSHQASRPVLPPPDLVGLPVHVVSLTAESSAPRGSRTVRKAAAAASSFEGGSSWLHAVAAASGGSFASVQLPAEHQTVPRVFEALASRLYTRFECRLALGHLQARVALEPSLDFVVSLPVVKDGAPPVVLNIAGFMPAKTFQSPPTVSSHGVFPVAGILAEETDRELYDILAPALQFEQMVALLTIVTDESLAWAVLVPRVVNQTAEMELRVFQPGQQHVPWLGLLQELAPLSKSSALSLPVQGIHKGSYVHVAETEGTVPLVPAGGTLPVIVEGCIKQIARACLSVSSVPSAVQSVYQHVNLLRSVAHTHFVPDVMEALRSLLISMLEDEVLDDVTSKVVDGLLRQLETVPPNVDLQAPQLGGKKGTMDLLNILN